MSVVSIAVMISFHLKSQPTDLELRMALPVGLIFWTLGVACLILGFGNYVKTVTKYSKRMAIVQTGWKTQVVGITSYITRTESTHNLSQVITFIAVSIVAICILFLSTKVQK